MVTRKHIIIGGGILVAGIVAFYVFWQSDHAKVKRRFEFIAEKMEKTPGEHKLISAAKANRMKEAFSETCTIHAPAYSFSRKISSDELSTLVLRMRSRYSEISLTFYDFVIDFPEEGTAQVTTTARMEGILTTGEPVADLHELKCRLHKLEDAWLLKEIEIVEVLKK